jgi:carbon-monoxide dehydrogenase small subunit
MQHVTLTVNNVQVARDVPDETLLAVFLREYLGLTGTHVGCDTTQCGCCVVHLDGTSVKSCTVLAAQADGGRVPRSRGLRRTAYCIRSRRRFAVAMPCNADFARPA